jgi:vanillate O-demethylase ferredoxin subunit
MSNTETLDVRLTHKRVEAQDICTFELASLDGSPLPAFSAGSHIDVHLGQGLVRQYSLCNDADPAQRYVIAVLKDTKSRGGSLAMHALTEGQTLKISRPRNHFAMARDARRSLLIAGGIGITPLLCMAQRLAATGADFEMHYCSRSLARAAFVAQIKASTYADKVAMHWDDSDAAQQLDVSVLLQQPVVGTHVYVCGPQGFMDSVLKQARAQGWPVSQLHYEFFNGDVAVTADDAAFEVQLASSGRVIAVAKNQSITQALTAAGVDVATACEQGVCGTCLTRVLAGVPDHRDKYLTPEEQAANDQLTPCCSRSHSPLLVLDL